MLVTVSFLAFISGCGLPAGKSSDTGKLKVITTLFPQYDFVREIAKDKADVTLLLPPGVESHSYEPSPQDIVNIKKSNAFIYTGENMEPWVHKVIENTKDNKLVVVDTSKGIELLDEEKHHEEHEEGEGEHPFEWAGAFNLKAGQYKWSFAKVDGKYADPEMKMVILNAAKSGKEGIETIHERAEELFKGATAAKKPGEILVPADTLYQLEFDSSKDISAFSIKIEKDGSYIFFTQHVPSEFEDKEHFFKDLEGKDIKPEAQKPEGEHHHHGGKDPHIWLDPVYAQKMVDNIVEGLSKADTKNESFYKESGESYKKKLQELDGKFAEAFKKTKYKKIMYGGHFAFGYFAKRYGLEHISPYSGFAPDAEPTPQRIAELIKNIKDSGVKVIYYEELVNPKVAKVISDQTGAKMLLLHGAHNVTKEELSSGITYIRIMEENLEKLKQGLGYNE
jgi:ABC-type Zn uptake system ZnuABC Zn-binding protein ZnuA